MPILVRVKEEVDKYMESEFMHMREDACPPLNVIGCTLKQMQNKMRSTNDPEYYPERWTGTWQEVKHASSLGT